MKNNTKKYDYILRTCDADLKAYNDFQWPASGPVEAPDWDPKPECKNGLHGLLRGEGNGSLLNFSTEAKWLIVEIEKGSSIKIGEDKVKFPRGSVVAVGDQKAITDIMQSIYPDAAVVGAVLTGGYGAVMAGGGYRATLTGGNSAILTGGYRANLTGGDSAILTGGYEATMTGGDYATMTGGYRAAMTGGDYAAMTGGRGAIMTGGYRAVMTGGDEAVMTGGHGAVFIFRTDKATLVARVGENGISPGKKYAVLNGKIVEVQNG